jgi:uncharacterized protein with PQ loop repeat
MEYEKFALVAGLIGTVALVPQYIRTQRTNNTDSFCPNSLCLKILGGFIMVWYAYKRQLPIILIGAIGELVVNAWMLSKINAVKV